MRADRANFIPPGAGGNSIADSGESRNPDKHFRILALVIGGFTSLGSGASRSDEGESIYSQTIRRVKVC